MVMKYLVQEISRYISEHGRDRGKKGEQKISSSSSCKIKILSVWGITKQSNVWQEFI